MPAGWGRAFLAAVGLEDLVATDVAAYRRIAAALAGDLARLEALRGGLRERVRRSILTDERDSPPTLEQCYIDIWPAENRAAPR